MLKKSISMLLTLSLCFSLVSVAFAAETTAENDIAKDALSHAYDEEYWEPISITLDDGSILEISVYRNPVWVESIPSITPPAPNSPMSSLYPEYPVGTVKSYPIRILNAQLMLSGTVAGTPLTTAHKQKLATLVASAINAQAAVAIVTAAGILYSIGAINTLFGNTGFIVTVTVEYTEHFINSQGHSVYAWDIKSARIATF